MKIKEIIGAICMIILTISGIILSFIFSINYIFSTDGILACMSKIGYFEETEQQTKQVLGHYMSNDEVHKILNNVNTELAIRRMVQSFGKQDIQQVANDVKLEMEQQVVKSLDESIPDDTKKEFAIVVSEAYIKSIFPVAEFNTLSRLFQQYETKLLLLLIILAVISLCIYMYLALGHKTYKWAIIALYNIIILNAIILLLIGPLNNIVIGNERTTELVICMLNSIKINVVIITLFILFISIISNYLAYFKRKKHLNNK